jgi:phosphoesterase RecJ-like protein
MEIQDIQAIQLLLATPKKIAIIPHRGPDGDAMGSTLGLYHFLLKNNHEPTVIANEFPIFLLGFQVRKQLRYSKRKRKLRENPAADLIFFRL